ncbi:MAG TPA: hypothetical protein O0X70_07505 [Methanocorpusculum sp.]|nr:hypothetical protein [Methanocorpusculum sp.]
MKKNEEKKTAAVSAPGFTPLKAGYNDDAEMKKIDRIRRHTHYERIENGRPAGKYYTDDHGRRLNPKEAAYLEKTGNIRRMSRYDS